jgi:hypothetical protein
MKDRLGWPYPVRCNHGGYEEPTLGEVMPITFIDEPCLVLDVVAILKLHSH